MCLYVRKAYQAIKFTSEEVQRRTAITINVTSEDHNAHHMQTTTSHHTQTTTVLTFDLEVFQEVYQSVEGLVEVHGQHVTQGRVLLLDHALQVLHLWMCVVLVIVGDGV